MKPKKKKWVMVVILGLLLAVIGAVWGWLSFTHLPAKQVSIVTSDITLPTFTLSVAKDTGMTEYLVLGMAATVKGPQALPTSWLKNHQVQVRAAILSSLLNLQHIQQANSNRKVRTKIRMAVSTDLKQLLKPGYHISAVYITRLLVQ